MEFDPIPVNIPTTVRVEDQDGVQLVVTPASDGGALYTATDGDSVCQWYSPIPLRAERCVQGGRFVGVRLVDEDGDVVAYSVRLI